MKILIACEESQIVCKAFRRCLYELCDTEAKMKNKVRYCMFCHKRVDDDVEVRDYGHPNKIAHFPTCANPNKIKKKGR